MNPLTFNLTTLNSVSNGALKLSELPSQLKVLAWGESKSVKGPVFLNQVSSVKLPDRQAALGFDRVALDFEHGTVPGTEEYNRTTEPRRVAAFGTPRVVMGDGLYLESMQWTPTGKSDALNFADLSPAVELDDERNVTFLHSVALTRTGAVEGLSFFSAASLPSEAQPLRFSKLFTLHVSRGKTKSAALAAAMKDDPASYRLWLGPTNRPPLLIVDENEQPTAEGFARLVALSCGNSVSKSIALQKVVSEFPNHYRAWRDDRPKIS